jgi:hypothetical protein
MTPALLDQFAAIVGSKNAIRNTADMAGYMKEWRDLWFGKSPLVLRPSSTEEVSLIMKLATETRRLSHNPATRGLWAVAFHLKREMKF